MNYIYFEDDAIALHIPNKDKKLLCLNTVEVMQFEINNGGQLKQPDINFHALLGVKILDGCPFLIVAEEAEPHCRIGQSCVYEIKKIGWIPVVPREKIEQVLEKTEQVIKDVAKLFEEGHHYYADDYKLFTTFSFNVMNDESVEQRQFYSQFIFNEGLMNPMPNLNLSRWCRPIIQGYIQQFQAQLAEKINLSFTLISRRSNRKQGTRYFARGIDDSGNVANFTETEQIIGYGQFMISHIQVRGSVPAFFEQLGISGLGGQLNITRNEATTQKAFQKHFNKLNQAYDRIFCVNLLSIKKSEEQKLTLFYEKLVSSFSPSYVKYEYFDFHQECKNDKFENADKLVEKVSKIIDKFGVTVFDSSTKKLISKQTGVFRTNCLDCLDRTNYMQSRIGLYQFKKIISNYSSEDIRNIIRKQEVFQNKFEQSSELLRKFNHAWAENGDKISLHYTGIGSTHTDITKTGKRTLMGTVNHKMRSLMRFFVQFTDVKKNEAINTISANNSLAKSTIYSVPSSMGQFINVCLLSYDIERQGQQENQNEVDFTENYVELKRPAVVIVYIYSKPEGHRLLKLIKRNGSKQRVQVFANEQTAVVRRQGYEIIKQITNNDNSMLIFGNEFAIQNASDIRHEVLWKHHQSLTVCKFNVYQTSMVFSGANCTEFEHFTSLVEESHDEAFQSNKLGQAKSASILSHSYRTIMGGTASGSKQHEIRELEDQYEWMKSKNDIKGQVKLVNLALDDDELANSIQGEYKYFKNYVQWSPSFIPSGNRIIFWHRENLKTGVSEYQHNKKVKCTYGHFTYELH